MGFKILGLFIMVFACYFTNRLIFGESEGNMIGTIIGAGTYILIFTSPKKTY